MMTTLKRFSLPILLLLVISCSQAEKAGEERQDEVLIENSGFFRGYILGSDPDSVLAIEEWTPTVVNDSMIQYNERLLLFEDTVTLDAYLAFDAYGLFEVQVDVFTMNDTLSKTIIDQWSESLSVPFGKPENMMTSRRWTTFSESNNVIEITLSQERNIESQKFISLNYLEPLDDEF